MNLGNNIKQLRKEKGLTQEQLSDELNKMYPNTVNFNKGKISKWENNKETPYLSSAKILADYFKITLDELINNEPTISIYNIYNQLEKNRQERVLNFADYQLQEQNKVIQLNNFVDEDLSGYAAAGTGQYVYDEPVETVRIPKKIIPEEPYDVMLEVVGDSMEPAFKDGEYIFIKHVEEVRSGAFAVFIINGESYLKKVYIEDDYMRLVSLNEKYEDIIVDDNDSIKLVGKVIS